MTNDLSVPVAMIGGNKVEFTNFNVNVKVTNPKGKSVTLKPDEFVKQMADNVDKLDAGEDFEFKSNKTKKALAIGGAVVGTAAVIAGVVYRKNIADYIKNFPYKKVGQDIKEFVLNAGKKIKSFFKKGDGKVRTVFDGEVVSKLSKETNALKDAAIAAQTNRNLEAFDKMVAKTKGGVHANKQRMYERLFGA